MLDIAEPILSTVTSIAIIYIDHAKQFPKDGSIPGETDISPPHYLLSPPTSSLIRLAVTYDNPENGRFRVGVATHEACMHEA